MFIKWQKSLIDKNNMKSIDVINQIRKTPL